MATDTTAVNPPEYFSIPDAPGMQFFRCTNLRATLSTTGCSKNYRSSLSSRHNNERLPQCRNCPIGALHSGEKLIYFSEYYDSNICARCRRPASRIIKRRICVSCQNREYEIIRGRNAKGQPPVKLPPLHSRRLRVVVEGRVSERTLQRTLDTAEVMLSVLRNERGRVLFAFTPPPPPIPQQIQVELV